MKCASLRHAERGEFGGILRGRRLNKQARQLSIDGSLQVLHLCAIPPGEPSDDCQQGIGVLCSQVKQYRMRKEWWLCRNETGTGYPLLTAA